MKKTILIITTFSCINLGMYAQTSCYSENKSEQTELLATVTSSTEKERKLEKNEVNSPLKTKAEMRQLKKQQRKQKKGFKDVSLGAKIGLGALAVGIVVFYIVTGGNGVSSR